jgi:hypothetical protein
MLNTLAELEVLDATLHGSMVSLMIGKPTEAAREARRSKQRG